MVSPRLLHLIVVLVLRLLALTAIWWFFIKDAKVAVDANGVANRVLMSEEFPQPITQSLPGENE